MLDAKVALVFAARLTPVPEFPRNIEAIEAVAEDLIDLTCDCGELESERRTQKIIQEIRRTWDTWTGTADLIRLYRRYWPEPREVKSEDNQVKNYGLKPPIECKLCNDTGAVKTDGRYDWCNCLTGVNLHFDMGQAWLDLLNAERPVIYQEPIRPHPAINAPVSKEVQDTITPTPECPGCHRFRLNGPYDYHTHAEFWKYHCKQEQPQ